MIKALTLALSLVVGLAYADGPYNRGTQNLNYAISGSQITVPGSSGQLLYNNGNALGATTSTYTSSTGGVVISGPLNLVSASGLFGLSRTGSTSGTLNINIISVPGSPNVGARFAIATAGTNNPMALLSTAGLLVGSFPTATPQNPSVTLHVSGSTIPGVANATITCTASQFGAVVASSARNTLAMCNGNGSWIPMVSTTIVSASSL